MRAGQALLAARDETMPLPANGHERPNPPRMSTYANSARNPFRMSTCRIVTQALQNEHLRKAWGRGSAIMLRSSVPRGRSEGEAEHELGLARGAGADGAGVHRGGDSAKGA